MPDEVASESSVGANDLKKPETSKSPWGFLRRLSGRFKKHEVVHQGVDQPKGASFEEVWTTFPSAEKLKPGGKVFFHTASEGNLKSLTKHGLYGNRTDCNMSANLGYSLFFPYEHTILRKNGSDFSKKELHVRELTPENYLLTVWQPNAEVRKSKEWLDMGFLETTGPTPGEIPEEYYKSSLHGSYIRSRPEDIGRVGPENLLAAIPLRRAVRDEFLKMMVLIAHNRLNADQLEEGILGLFSKESGTVLMDDRVSLPVLARLLTSSLERELVRCKVAPMVKHCLGTNQEVYQDDLTKKYRGYPLKVLWEIMKQRMDVNDKTTATYLDKAAKAVAQRITEQGIDIGAITKAFKEKIDLLKVGQEVPEPDFGSYGSFYSGSGPTVISFYGGGNVAIDASSSMEKELGFH